MYSDLFRKTPAAAGRAAARHETPRTRQPSPAVQRLIASGAHPDVVQAWQELVEHVEEENELEEKAATDRRQAIVNQFGEIIQEEKAAGARRQQIIDQSASIIAADENRASRRLLRQQQSEKRLRATIAVSQVEEKEDDDAAAGKQDDVNLVDDATGKQDDISLVDEDEKGSGIIRLDGGGDEEEEDEEEEDSMEQDEEEEVCGEEEEPFEIADFGSLVAILCKASPTQQEQDAARQFAVDNGLTLRASDDDSSIEDEDAAAIQLLYETANYWNNFRSASEFKKAFGHLVASPGGSPLKKLVCRGK